MDLYNLRVLSVLPVLGQPRDSKRIAMLQQAGFAVEAVAFKRDYHTGRLPDCPVERLGKIAHGRYLQRIRKIIVALPTIRQAIRRNHLVYASGPDMALTALVAGFGLGRPVILEVGDIQRIQVASGLKGHITRFLDRHIVSSSKLLVATAPGFVEGYYRGWLHTKTPALLLENKLDATMAEVDHIEPSERMKGKPLVDRPLRIGYFGLLRCGWSWQVLEALALSRPTEVEIIVAGYPMEPIDLPERAARIANVEFRGEYRSPQDLPSLYGDVDLIWGCYPYPASSEWNWRWARTNRFYESCFFQKPIISLMGSGDGIEVAHHQIGLIIHEQSLESVMDAILRIRPDDMALWQNNLSKLPSSVYLYTTEIDELQRVLRDIAVNYLAEKKS